MASRRHTTSHILALLLYRARPSRQLLPGTSSDYSFNHHNLVIPIKLYFNFINNDKLKLYSYVGLNPRFVLDVVYTVEWLDQNNEIVNRQSASMNSLASYGYQPSIFKLEAQAGLGMSYKFSNGFIIDANLLFGIDSISTYGVFMNEHQYRFAGNTGFGYSF